MRLLTVVVLAACSSRAPTPTRPEPDQPVGHGSASRTDGGTEMPAASGPPTDEQCTRMIDHVIDIDVAERPADQKPIAHELAKVRTDMRTRLLPECRKMPRPQVDCVLAATSSTGITACAGTPR